MVRKSVLNLLLLFPILVFGQQNQHFYEGQITNGKGVGIDNVLCKLMNEKDSLLTYAISQTQGQYQLPYSANGVKILFTKMGYAPYVQSVNGKRHVYNITLEDKAFQLEGVVIKADPITRHKDTLNYNVASFTQKEDIHIEDVLKRLPGIEVSESGKITYQGLSVNKLNIEGMDLMGDQYNQATQNMPVEAVSQIQVMENNQPIRALEGKVRNNHATLNIKLKKDYKYRPFGEVEGGYGLPALWDGNLAAIQLSKKNQLLVTASTNNRGASLQSLTRTMGNQSSMYAYEPLPSPFVYSPGYRNPPISPLFYLDNKSYFTGVNYLHAFSKISTLRINLAYNHEREARTDSSFNSYILSDSTINIFENNNLRKKSHIFSGVVRYELNSKKVYLTDVLSGHYQTNKSQNNNTTKLGPLTELTERKPFYIQNALDMHINTADLIYDITSMVRYYESDEYLAVSERVEGQDQNYNLRLKNWMMRHRVGSTFNVWNNPFSVAYIAEYKHHELGNKTMDSQFSHYWLHTLEPSYCIEFGNGEMEISCPLEYIAYQNQYKGAKDERFIVSPFVDFTYRFGTQSRIDISTAYNQNANTANTYLDGIVRNNYRTYTVGIDSLSIEKTSTANISYSYLNTVKMLSFKAYVGWNRTMNDYYLNSLYTGDFTLISPVWDKKRHDAWSASVSAKKIFRDAGLTFDVKGGYSYNKSFVSQNTSESYISYHAAHSEASINWHKLSWLSANLKAAGNVSWKNKDEISAEHNLLKNGYYSVTLDFYPISKLRIYADFSQTAFELDKSHYSVNGFLNAGLRYDVSKSFSLSLSGVNLLNRKEYQESFFNGLNYQFFRMPLRGCEAMISAKYRF